MNPRRLYRSRDRSLAGVAGGMAEYLDIDPTVMRILWVLAALLSAGLAILAYILLAIVIPDAPWAATPAGAPMWGPAAQTPAPGWAPPAPGWAASSAQPAGWGAAGTAAPSREQGRGIGAAAAVGLLLIGIGGIALLNAVIPGWIVPAASGPMILVLVGGAFLVASIRRAPQAAAPSTASSASAPAAPAPAAAAMGGATADPTEATAADVPFAEPPSDTDIPS